jgi:hypothetical protein
MHHLVGSIADVIFFANCLTMCYPVSIMKEKTAKSPVKSGRLSFRTTPEMARRITAVAERNERTTSWVIDRVLRKCLSDLEKQNPSFEAGQLQLAA